VVDERLALGVVLGHGKYLQEFESLIHSKKKQRDERYEGDILNTLC
jgi:hypothetical protein